MAIVNGTFVALDSSLGAMLLGTWVNSWLYMFEFLQVLHFFRTYPKDPKFIKIGVALTFTVDTICTAATYAMIYQYAISSWGDAEALTKQYWPFPTYCTTTGLAALIVQSFLTFRFYTLSQNKIITLLLSVLVLSAIAGTLTTSFFLILFPKFTDRGKLVIPVAVWFISSVCADVFLAIALVWQLNKVRSPFRDTRGLISRLTSIAVSSGTITSVVALCVLGTYLANVESNIPVGFNFILGRVYALTMLFNLNARNRLQKAIHSGTTEAHSVELTRATQHVPIDLSVQVQQSVHVDGSQSQYDIKNPSGHPV